MKNPCVILLLLFTLNAASQVPFHRFYGGSQDERGQRVIETLSQQLLINGATTSYGAGSADGMLVKTDAAGNVIWTKVYGTSDYENPESAIETSDGGYVCGGRIGLTNSDALLYKTDSLGQMMWSKSYGSPATEGIVYLTAAGNKLLSVGYAPGQISGTKDVLFMVTDHNGDTVFTRTYGTGDSEVGICVLQNADSTYMICGRKEFMVNGSLQSDAFLMKIDEFGFPIWTKVYGDSLWEEFQHMTFTPEGHILICGSQVTTAGAGNYDILLSKMDTSGNSVWTRVIGGQHTDASYNVNVLHDGYSLVGYTESFGYGHERGAESANIFMLKTDTAGVPVWMQTYGDGLIDEAYRGTITTDGGFLIAGFTSNYLMADSTQMVVIRTDNQGFSGCHEIQVMPEDTLLPLPVTTESFTTGSGMNVSTVILFETSIQLPEYDACLFAFVNDASKVEASIFPNPVGNSLTIHGLNPDANNLITLLTTSGIEVLSKNFSGNEYVLDISGIPAGIYLLCIEAGGSKTVRKIVRL